MLTVVESGNNGIVDDFNFLLYTSLYHILYNENVILFQ